MNKLDKIIERAVERALGLEVGDADDQPNDSNTYPIPVVVCTDKRAVVFGYTDNPKADPISLTNARMCLYWDKATGGVFGLSENGPTSGCKISAKSDRVSLTGIIAVFDVTETAVSAWVSAPVQGR
jgi:hypothetical protein